MVLGFRTYIYTYESTKGLIRSCAQMYSIVKKIVYFNVLKMMYSHILYCSTECVRHSTIVDRLFA